MEEIRKRLLGRLEAGEAVSDERLLEMIDEEIVKENRRNRISLERRIPMRAALFNSLRRLDVLQEFLEDETVTEIMVNGPDRIFLERGGKLQESGVRFSSREKLEDMIQQVVSRVNRTVNVSNPIADARLADGSRVHVVLPPVSLDGPVMTIRKFPRIITMEMLVESGSITQEAADFLKKLVRAGYNLFISGGTNSGKTTFLNALSAYIPADERVITIEDSAELQIQQVKNLVRLETRTANSQG